MAGKKGEMFTHAAGFTFGDKEAPQNVGPSGVRIEHRIGVNAPAEAIWAQLADIPGWSSWNPLYPQAAGELRIGSRLDLTVAIPGQAHRKIRPVILDWVPNDQIHWRLSALGGLVQSTRYLEIEILGPTNCIFSNGEIFGGLLGPTVARQLGRSVRRGFAAMGEAVKARAEAASQSAGTAPTSGTP